MKRLPEHFKEGDEVMSNFDHEVDVKVAYAMTGQELFGAYSGWKFYGKCWWDGQWNCEVWVHGSYQETVSADTLEEIMLEVSNKYGHE